MQLLLSPHIRAIAVCDNPMRNAHPFQQSAAHRPEFARTVTSEATVTTASRGIRVFDTVVSGTFDGDHGRAPDPESRGENALHAAGRPQIGRVHLILCRLRQRSRHRDAKLDIKCLGLVSVAFVSSCR